jgi:hypothetical protein
MTSFSRYRVHLRSRKSWLQGTAIVLTLVVICHVTIVTIHDLENYRGIDLRAKVIGARLLSWGMNPHYDFCHEPHEDHLRMLATNTYSPALLLRCAPLCELDWRVQRFSYFPVDWVAILRCYVKLARIFPKRASGTALWAGFVLLLVADVGSRFHLERGQYYVEFALLTTSLRFTCFASRTRYWILFPRRCLCC